MLRRAVYLILGSYWTVGCVDSHDDHDEECCTQSNRGKHETMDFHPDIEIPDTAKELLYNFVYKARIYNPPLRKGYAVGYCSLSVS